MLDSATKKRFIFTESHCVTRMMHLSGGRGCSLGINQYLVDHFALLGGDEMLGSSPILG